MKIQLSISQIIKIPVLFVALGLASCLSPYRGGQSYQQPPSYGGGYGANAYGGGGSYGGKNPSYPSSNYGGGSGYQQQPAPSYGNGGYGGGSGYGGGGYNTPPSYGGGYNR